jgi:hypothetical protein
MKLNLLWGSFYSYIRLDLGIFLEYLRGYPGQKQPIKNEEVIKAAIGHASSSKQLFKKYFPSK